MSQHDRDNVRYIAGAMSGTSADGVDIAITRITGTGVDMTAQLVRHHHQPYSAALRKEIFAFRAGEVNENVLSRLAKMGREISLAYATAINDALKTASMDAKQLAAVAAHGQTLFHGPPDTIQWFDPTIVAAEVGCQVISDFRRADLAAGGQGAPLVPFADYILFRHPTKNRVLLNIGGIANITYLKAGGTLEEVIAFDTGPGNCISDWICRTSGPFELSWDVDGAGASHGRVIPDIASRFLDSAYFAATAPKSTDGPDMIQTFERACGDMKDAAMNDLLGTAAFLTGKTIALAIAKTANRVDEVLVSGGGVRNKAIMGWLRSDLSATLRVIDEHGVDSDAKEAIAFALLGAATLDGLPSNVPSVTGAKRAVVLGSITPKP